jgi:hypothetical protein
MLRRAWYAPADYVWAPTNAPRQIPSTARVFVVARMWKRQIEDVVDVMAYYLMGPYDHVELAFVFNGQVWSFSCSANDPEPFLCLRRFDADYHWFELEDMTQRERENAWSRVRAIASSRESRYEPLAMLWIGLPKTRWLRDTIVWLLDCPTTLTTDENVRTVHCAMIVAEALGDRLGSSDYERLTTTNIVVLVRGVRVDPQAA